MQKKKENFLDKVIKKNFNNELEHVLEHKNYDENTKNILLSIMYKLEAAYSDYEQVKKNVMPKDEFLQSIIDIIEKDIDTIKLVKINSPEAEQLQNKTFLIDKRNKQIICYPIERKLLYAISKISKKEKIIKDKYYVINKTISDLLTVGNNINTVEAIRDFNGFSWSVVAKDVESIDHNIVYQNLRILVGAEFLNNWIYNRESIIDYFELFKNTLQQRYGKDFEEEIIDELSKISVLLEVKYNPEKAKSFLNGKKEIEKKLEEIKNTEEFTLKLTKEKKSLNKKIKSIDTIISDKKLLQEEYEKRNELLPLDKKIFSMRVLSNMMKEDRKKLENKRENINKMLNPQKFIKYQNELEQKYKYIQYIETNNVDNKITAEVLNFQELFLECYKIKAVRANTKEEIINLITEFRYYLNIPINKTKKINEVNHFNALIQEISKLIINKAIKEKVLINISKDEAINYLIYKELFNTKIINLQNINVEMIKENDALNLQIYDENIFDNKIEVGKLATLDFSTILIRFNKLIKIFIV